MASTFELLPNYNFVRNQGGTEPWPDTYARQVHDGTGQPAITIIRRFRSSIVHERELEGWLRARGLEYHFLAGTGFPTVLGYDRGRDRLLTGREGDGTVPLDSARLLPGSTPNLHTTILSGERDLGHQRLCQRHDVQRYCLRVLHGQRPAAGGGANPAGSVAKETRRQIDLSRATRFITVACPSQLTNKEWKRADPSRALPLPVYKDYALMKVLYTLRRRNLNTPVHVNAFQYEKPLTPLDFTFLRDSDVIFIAGHGNEKGLYTMGPNTSDGMDRLVEILTADGNLERHRRGKEIIIMLLSCRAGLGFHKGLARRLARRLSIDTIVGGAQGFTFGSIRTGPTACNEVLVRGIPWVMEYPGSIPLREAENETSAREGKTITYDGKRTEIERFLNDKRALEKAMTGSRPATAEHRGQPRAERDRQPVPFALVRPAAGAVRALRAGEETEQPRLRHVVRQHRGWIPVDRREEDNRSGSRRPAHRHPGTGRRRADLHQVTHSDDHADHTLQRSSCAG